MIDRVLVGGGQKIAAGPDEHILLRAADVHRRHRLEDRLIAPEREQLVLCRDCRVRRGVERQIEAPDVAVEIAEVRLGDEALIRRPGRDRVGLQRVLDLLAAGGVGHAVVDRFVHAVAADVHRREHGARLRVQHVEGGARLHAVHRPAAVGLLLRRVRQEAGSEEHAVRARCRRHLADGRIRPRLPDGLLERRCRRLQVAVWQRVARAGDRLAVNGDGQRRIEAGVARERPVQLDERRIVEAAEQCRHRVIVGRNTRCE